MLDMRLRARTTSLLFAGATVWIAFAIAGVAPSVHGQARPDTKTVSQDDQAYMCPMHPDIVSEVPGKCPRCQMALVLGRPYDMRDYRLELHTMPAVVHAGEKTRLFFDVFHPDTDARITAFTEVHQKRYHLFVISQDLEYFDHVHPEQDDQGRWWIDVTLPKPGYYKLLSDFVPFGGSPQFIALPIVTAGYASTLIEDEGHIEPDTSTKTVGDLTATVAYDPAVLIPANHSHLTFHLTRGGSDEPVRDLQTYLGAFGHILIVSEDLTHFVHSHPIYLPPQDADNLDDLLGGPDVIFEALLPQPGRYRAWAQFRYHDTVRTFPFTFAVRQ